MSKLSVTLIDVGWGDSIFIEHEASNGKRWYALIDSNDTTSQLSSFIFLKRYFEKKDPDALKEKQLFDFILLTHTHADHGQGLKKIIREFGTKYFWYSKSASWCSQAALLEYANRSDKVWTHEALNSGKKLPKFGNVTMKAIWPHDQYVITNNENNNSVVLALTLGEVTFLLTGDAEAEVWQNVAPSIPATTRFFKLPHHGSVNGSFDQRKQPVWINNVPTGAHLGISSHVRPFSHPSPEVIELLDNRGFQYYRTDEHYHITVETDGSNVNVKYSHV